MIELHTLGGLDLRDAAGREVRSVLQQPKRLALLAFLALASPRRYHRRDSLLAMFWPELDEEHARAALRRSLYFLRSALGAEAIEGRGEEEVGVAAGTLWCDAVAFEAGVRDDDPARALELYRGDLMEGFHVSGAPAVQDWLDRERGRLREVAARAAWSLAEAAERARRPAEAGRWGRRAFELMADDEDALRRLLQLLDRTGDRSGAFRAYDGFARRLALEYGLEPAAETRALLEAIRTRPDRPGGAPVASTPAAAPAEVDIGRGRPVADPRVVAVFPFAVRGDLRFGYLAEGMVELLSATLDGAGDVRTVDARSVLAAAARRAWTDGDPDLAREAAAELGAGLVVLGSIVEAGGRLQATATLYGPEGPRGPVQSQRRAEAQLFELVDELARQLAGVLVADPGARLARLAARMTGSLPALKAYLEGERWLRGGRYFDAMEALQRAVGEDPEFALAHYRLAAAAAGCARPELARASAERGHAYRSRLAEHERLLLDAQRAWLAGEVTNAESLYTVITASHPEDVEAWFHLADLLFHCNPLRGRSATEARGAFERVLWHEPDHVASLAHLMRIAAIEGRREEALALAARVRALSPQGDQALALEAFAAFAARDEGAIGRVIESLGRARAVTVGVAFSDVALYSGNADGAERLARAFLAVARSPELRAVCRVALAHLALGRGRWRAALAELESAEALGHPWGLEVRALFAALPFAPADRAELAALRRRLDEWDPSAVPPSSLPPFAAHGDPHAELRSYLAGLLAECAGDLQGARAALARLDAARDRQGAPTAYCDSLRMSLACRIARAESGAGEALVALGDRCPELWFQFTVASPFQSLAYERFLRAELLREAGRVAEALGWYGSIAERSPYELVYAAPAHLRRAEMFEQRGDRAAARAEYRRFLELWDGADAELEPVVRGAARRLGALTD